MYMELQLYMEIKDSLGYRRPCLKKKKTKTKKPKTLKRGAEVIHYINVQNNLALGNHLI